VSPITFENSGDYVQREIVVTEGDHSFDLLAVRKAVAGKQIVLDAAQFLFDTTLAPAHILRYFARSTDNADLFAMRWMIWKIVEFTDIDGDLTFTPGTDTIVSQYPLWLRSWSVMSNSKTVLPNNSTIYEICTHLNGTASPRPDVEICLIIAENATIFRGIRLDPNSIKWNITISNYPYAGTTSRLAIKASFDTRQVAAEFDAVANTTYKPAPNERGYTCSGNFGGAQALSGYVSTGVFVEGANCTSSCKVNSTTLHAGEWSADVDTTFPHASDIIVVKLNLTAHEQIVYHSFQTNCYNPSVVGWDPEVGAFTPPAPPVSTTTAAAAATSAAATSAAATSAAATSAVTTGSTGTTTGQTSGANSLYVFSFLLVVALFLTL